MAQVKTLFGNLYNLMGQTASFAINPWGYIVGGGLDALGDVAIHKMRVSQARHFLGDTFAERFDNYLKQNQAYQSVIGVSNTAIIDYIPSVKSTTTAISDKVVGGGFLSIQNWLFKKLPPPLNKLGELMANSTLLHFTRNYLGSILSYVIFPPGAFAMYLVAITPLIIRNPWIFRTAYLEMAQAIRLTRRGGTISSAAIELIDPNIPLFIFDDFVTRNRATLRDSNFAASALDKLRTIPMPLYAEYFAILIRHFARQLADPSRKVICSGYNWFTSKASDALLQLVDIVGVFKFRGELAAQSYRKFLKGLDLYYSRNPTDGAHELALLYIDYFLSNMGIPEKLLTQKSEDDSDDEFCRKCQSILQLFLPTNQDIEYVLRSGLTAWSALAARYLPLPSYQQQQQLRPQQQQKSSLGQSANGSAKPSLHGPSLLRLAIHRAHPLSMLAILRNVPGDVWGKLLPSNYRPNPTIGNLSTRLRPKQLVFDAFVKFRNYHGRPHFICRMPLYVHPEDVDYKLEIPVELAFLPKRWERPLSEDERRLTAIAIAYLVFNIPLDMARKVKKLGTTVIESVNLILEYHCGFFKDRLVSAQAANLVIPRASNTILRSTPHALTERAKPSILPFHLNK